MKETKRNLLLSLFPLLLVLAWIAVIFSFSLHSGVNSHDQSNFVKAFLSEIAKRIDLHVNHRFYQLFYPFVEDKSNITSDVVIRKVAHFTEYFIFGLLCSATALLFREHKSLRYLPLFGGILISLIDERIIQRFLVVGRTSSFMDVLLDCIGFYFAAALCGLLAAFVFWVRRKVHNAKK